MGEDAPAAVQGTGRGKRFALVRIGLVVLVEVTFGQLLPGDCVVQVWDIDEWVRPDAGTLLVVAVDTERVVTLGRSTGIVTNWVSGAQGGWCCRVLRRV